MLTLYSYPPLFGVADNNGYGLKIFAFLQVSRIPFRHEHVFDASAAPRGQLPYITQDDMTVGDSGKIIDFLRKRYTSNVEENLADGNPTMDHLVTRMLDDLYWVISYSRWKDDRYWPLFRDAFLNEHSVLTEADLQKARNYNLQRYHFQGIGRYEPDDAYQRGLADLKVLADLLPKQGYMHGERPSTVDAAIYGFIANIYFYAIETPLKRYVLEHQNIVDHCCRMHAAVASGNSRNASPPGSSTTSL